MCHISKIYEVLGTLEEKGWIGSDDSRANKIFSKVTCYRIGYHKTKDRDGLYREPEHHTARAGFHYMRRAGQVKSQISGCCQGQTNITLKILEMVDACRNEVMIALPDVGVELVKQALPKAKAAA